MHHFFRSIFYIIVGSFLAVVVFGCGRVSPAPTVQPNVASPVGIKSEVAKKVEGVQIGVERNLGADVFLMVHRLQVENPTTDDWHRADSKEGGFSIEIPLPFNDARIRGTTTDNVELRTHVIGTKTPGLLSYTATCIVRRDGKLGPDDRAPQPDSVDVRGNPPTSYNRKVEFKDRSCILVIESQGADPLPSEDVRSRFLNSLEITGPAIW